MSAARPVSPLRRMTRVAQVGAPLLVVMLLVAACGESSSRKSSNSSKTTTAPTVTVEPDGTQVVDLRETNQYRFTPEEPHVLTGPVRIDFNNTSTTVTHSLAFKPGGPVEEIPFVNPKTKKSISFDVNNPGKYKFFCTFHESLGQRGTLVVEPR